MALVRVEKDKFNLRSKLNELDYGHVPYEKMPPGTVIQHVYITATGNLTTTNSSWTDLSWSVSIAPRFSSSLMLIELSALGQQPNTATGVSCVTIYRNNVTNLGDTSSSNMGLSCVGDFSSSGGVFVTTPQTFFVYDNPQTTSKTSYNLWGRRQSTGSGTAYCTHNSVTRTLSVKEIRQ